MKRCTKCNTSKELQLFAHNKNTEDGYSYWCLKCHSENTHRYYSENKAKCLSYAAKYRNSDRGRVKMIRAKHYYKNRDKLLVGMREYQKNNKEAITQKRKHNAFALSLYAAKRYESNKERLNLQARQWKQNNPALVTAMTAKRRATKLNATPHWLSPQQHNEMKAIYKNAKEMTKTSGIRHEVDHIFPLVNKLCCGLHIPSNLQIITAVQNRKKNNKVPLNRIV